LLLRIEIVFAKEAMIYLYSLRKSSRLNTAKKGLQCGLLLYKAIKSRRRSKSKDFDRFGRPTGVFFKGKPPDRRRGVRNGEIQLDRKPQSLLFLPPSHFFIKHPPLRRHPLYERGQGIKSV